MKRQPPLNRQEANDTTFNKYPLARLSEAVTQYFRKKVFLILSVPPQEAVIPSSSVYTKFEPVTFYTIQLHTVLSVDKKKHFIYFVALDT